jgi:hypothetical protein
MLTEIPPFYSATVYAAHTESRSQDMQSFGFFWERGYRILVVSLIVSHNSLGKEDDALNIMGIYFLAKIWGKMHADMHASDDCQKDPLRKSL